MMDKRVSIIVPAYNCEDTIRGCIQSIRGQTYKNIEIIIVNDGSTDNTYSVCRDLADWDKRIVIINQENQGVSVARNQGLSRASGAYIQFVDADDTIEPDMTATLVYLIEQCNCPLVICGYTQYKNGSEKVISFEDGLYKLDEFKDKFVDLYNEWMINMPWNKLYMKEFIHKRFQEDITLGEDLIFNLDYFIWSRMIAVTSYHGYNYYFKNGKSLAGSFRPDKIEYSKMLHEKVCEFLKNDKINDKVFVREIRYSMTNLMRSDLSGDKKKEFIKKWCKDTAVVSGYECARELSIVDNILKKLVLANKPKIIYWLLKVTVR